jgi:hypothetical protein
MSLTREVFFCPYGVRCGADLSRPDHGEPVLSYVAMGQRQAAPQRSLCAGVRPVTLCGRRISTSSLRPTGVPGTRCAAGLAGPRAASWQGQVVMS